MSRRQSMSPTRHTRPSPSVISHQPSSPGSGLPTQTFHHSLLPGHGNLFESVAGGAHYSGVDPVKERRLSIRRTSSHGVPKSPARTYAEIDEEPTAEEMYKDVLNDLNELYECRPTAELLERRFTRSAEFEDPLARCKGLHEIASQFFSFSHVIAKSTTLGRRVLSSPLEKHRVVFWQKMEYVMRYTGFKKVVESIVVVELDSEQHITRLVDQWNGKELPTAWGALHLRRLHGRVLSWVPYLSSTPRRRSS